MEQLASLAMPLTVTATGLMMLWGRRDHFVSFTRGAAEGLRISVRLLPTLCALLVAVSMLNASGAVEQLAAWLAPVAGALGIPTELLPLLLTRPFSGSASSAMLSDLLSRVGTDSFTGLCASVIYGSSDTVVYIVSVYFSSVGIRRTRWALPCAFAVMLFCVFFSCFLCRICFS